ncbi:carboxymuconolactone decarboxylase family protein [candidate division KSB1 bacterium]|nr:carboxymuconolactone decarboxylase family protein [candidate division KSB1 bacterium]
MSIENSNLLSEAFKTFMTEAPAHSKAWGELIQSLAQANVLDRKTSELTVLAILAALNRISGIPFHVAAAKSAGASRDEVISAVLIGLPQVGHLVTQALPVALKSYDTL